MSVAIWNSKCMKIIYFLINPWSQAHTSTDCVNRSACKLQYLKSNSRILYARNNNFSMFSPSKLYFDDQNKSVQRHWIVVRWQHLLVAPTRIFWREGLLTQADCSSRDSRLSLLSAYCLILMRALRVAMYTAAGCDCRWLRVLPAVHWLSQSTDFLFFVVFTAILVPKKRKENECLFRPKNKTPKNKKCAFWRRKIKRKRNSVGL